MELADPVERIFFIRDNGSVPFDNEPTEVYEYEYVGEKCWIRHKEGKKAYPYGRVRVKEVHSRETRDPRSRVVRRSGWAFDNVERIAMYDGYLAVRFSNGSCKVYAMNEVSLD